MPLTTDGENYREFSEPRFFEAETLADIAKIRSPVDKAHAVLAPDNGGSLDVWKFKKDDTTTADGWDVITPNNTQVAGRFRRLTSQFINVLSFGADPTGETSSTAAVEAAYAKLGDKGGTLFFPAGIYKFNLLINQHNVRILGDSFVKESGAGDVSTNYFQPADVSLPVIRVGDELSDARGVRIENCTFVSTLAQATAGSVAIHLSGGAIETWIQNVAIYKYKIGIKYLNIDRNAYTLHYINGVIECANVEGARCLYALQPTNSTPFLFDLGLVNVHMQSPLSVGDVYAVEIDGVPMWWSNVYCDLGDNNGILMKKTNSGTFDPYITCSNVHLDTTGSSPASSVTVDIRFSSTAFWGSYLRGQFGATRRLKVANGTTVSPIDTTITDAAEAYRIQVTGELALTDLSQRTGASNFGYDATKTISASGTTMVFSNSVGGLTANISGTINLAPQGAGGETNISGGALGLNFLCGTRGSAISDGHLMVANGKGFGAADSGGVYGLLIGCETDDSVTIAARGSDVNVFNGVAGKVVNFFPGNASQTQLKLDYSVVANETCLILRENGSLSRVLVGAAGTGPGGSGRALYVA
jgi:hypothetical protein